MSFDQRETNDSHEVHCVEPQESVSAPRRMVRWFRDIWQDLVDTANPSTGSKHGEDLTPAELEKQASFESYDYYKAYPTMYIEHLRRTQRPASSSGSPGQDAPMSPTFSAAASHIQTYQANGDERRHIIVRWLLHILIALSVGVVAAVVAYAVDALESYRSVTLHHIINNASVRFGGCLVGFFFWVSASAAFVSIATAVVVFFEPAAAGGGIPDVMAYLNGVQLRRAMNIRTFLAKIVSCVFAVAGGLPVGLEAPLIHLGAITGAGVTQGRSRTLGFQTSLFSGFRNNKDRRDFITAGAACGVSAAFGAPIGGLLFVMEEVCSFWDHSASGQIFLATMVCFTFTSIINSAVEDRRLLGWVSNSVSVLFEVNVTIPLNLIAIVPSLFLGAMSGALAALFTKLNIILIKWRRVRLQPYPLRRVAEPVLIAVTYCGFMYLLTLVSECRHIEPIVDAANDTFHIWGTETEERLFDDLCFKSNAYSPFGSLSMLSGKTAIRHLFSRQTAGEFPWYYLLLFVVLYFIFACLSSGAAVSGGLVVPSLVLGAAFGRLFGLVLWTVGATHNPSIPHSYAATDSWMDPGVFALIGAGAFLAGTSRMTMSICVIMVELSAELHYLLPVMVAIVVSKTVADWLAEPLYHHMLHLTCVPYLPHDLERSEFEQLTAADVMASPVVTLRTKERTEVVLRALRNTSHHAFPVVEAVEGDDDDDVDVELEESRTRSRMCGQSAGTDLTTPATGLQRMKSTSSIGGGSTTRRRARRYKFVGLVTREDLQVYLSLPELRRPVVSSNASDVPKENPSVPPPTHPSPPTVQLLDQGMSWEDSDGFGGRLEACVMEVNRMNWKGWIRHKSSLFFGERQMVSNRPPALPRAPLSTVDVGRLNLSQGVDMDSIEAQLADLPQVVDLSLIINRSPWVVPPFFNLQMTYHTFRTMGLRHLVVVDGDTVSGIITRKDLLLDALRRRMRELWQRGEDDVMGVTIRSTSSTSVETDVRRGLRVSGNEQSIRSGLSPAESTIPLPGPSLLRRPASMPNAVNPLPHAEDGLLQTGSVTVDVVEPSAAQSCPP